MATIIPHKGFCPNLLFNRKLNLIILGVNHHLTDIVTIHFSIITSAIPPPLEIIPSFQKLLSIEID